MSGNSTQQAMLLERLADFFGDTEGGWTKAKETLEFCRKKVTEFEETTLREVLEKYDKLKARTDTLQHAIRNSRRGGYISGIEDESFNLCAALVAFKTGNWKYAGKEKEIIDQASEKFMTLRGQTMHDDEKGGSFIPDQVIPDVIEAIYKRSAFIALDEDGDTRFSVLEGLAAGTVKIPKFNGGLIAYWIGDEDEYTESVTTVGDVTMNPKKLGVLVRLTDSMKRFPAYGYDALLRRDMSKAAATKIDWTALYGPGTDNSPRGILANKDIALYSAALNAKVQNNAAAIASASADWAGGDLDFDGLEEIKLLLEEDDIVLSDEEWAIVSSPRYFSNLRRLKIENYSGQTSGQPYLLGAPMLPEARLRDLIGSFSKTSQIMSNLKPGASVNAPTTSANLKYTDVVAGDLSQCIFARWAGIEIEDDGGMGKGFTSDHTYLKLRMYADIGYRQTRSLLVCPDAKVRV